MPLARAIRHAVAEMRERHRAADGSLQGFVPLEDVAQGSPTRPSSPPGGAVGPLQDRGPELGALRTRFFRPSIETQKHDNRPVTLRPRLLP